jgi:hypothetical protein
LANSRTVGLQPLTASFKAKNIVSLRKGTN